ncbi:unnamed protein product, partial [Didymodactylos carnosus]
MFENLVEMLHFYACVTRRSLCVIRNIYDGNSGGWLFEITKKFTESLLKYPNLTIIRCGSFEEELCIPLVIIGNNRESTLTVDADHLIVDKNYLVVRNMKDIFQNNQQVLTFKPAAHDGSDQVFALECKAWPESAQNWIERISKNGWPSYALKEKIKANGCHLVPTGYDEDEWRISFTCAELELLNTISKKHKMTYGLLKFLIKYLCCINDITVFKSYQLKTLFLRYCE